MGKLFEYIRSSLLGSVLYMLVAFGVTVNDGWKKEEMSLILLSFLLGVLSGAIVEYFLQRLDALSKRLTAVLDQVNGSNAELSNLGAFLTEYEPFTRVNWQEKTHQWALQSAFAHAWKVPADDPADAREKFCTYLRDGLRHSEKWLGIHEDRVSFFYDRSSLREREAYIDALKIAHHSKIRIFVKTKDNKEDFNNYDTIKNYLAHVKDHNIESYVVDQYHFHDIVKPPQADSFRDWALYDDSVLLEFDAKQKLILFHVKDHVVDGVRRLLLRLNSNDVWHIFEPINDEYLEKLDPKKRKTVTTSRSDPAGDGSP